jgi:hypothetical protein
MKFTTVAADAFQKFQMNAGVLLTDFNPASPTIDRSKIIGATSGGCTFTATPTFVDFGDDVDNVPANTMELKVLQSVEVKMSGTFKTVDTMLAKQLMGSASLLANGKIVPRLDLRSSDFKDIWWVGDYSDQNEGTNAGFMAVKLINGLATGGFQIKSNDDGKGEFSFEYTGHYSINDISKIPYELYIRVGEAETAASSALSALSVGTSTLVPTFAASTFTYATTTTNDSDTITATAGTGATVAIVVNKQAINGTTAHWLDGANEVVIEVNNGDNTSTYTINVTKGA